MTNNENLDLKVSNGITDQEQRETELRNEITSEINKFLENSYDNYASFVEWNKFLKDYRLLLEKIKKLNINELKLSDKIKELDIFYNDALIRYNDWCSKELCGLENKTNKFQINSLAIFSVFMTLLTFVLSNVLIISKTDFNLKNFVLINLLLISITFICFYFIGRFLDIFKVKSLSKLFRILIWGIPILCIIAITLVCLFMK